MAYKILNKVSHAVTFEADAQTKADRLTIPAEVLRGLGLDPGDEIRLRIESLDGQERWAGVHPMRSGAEIYGSELDKAVVAGERFRIVASRV